MSIYFLSIRGLHFLLCIGPILRLALALWWKDGYRNSKRKRKKTSKNKVCPSLGHLDHIERLIVSVLSWFPKYLFIQFCSQMRDSSLSLELEVGSASPKAHTLGLEELPFLRGKWEHFYQRRAILSCAAKIITDIHCTQHGLGRSILNSHVK